MANSLLSRRNAKLILLPILLTSFVYLEIFLYFGAIKIAYLTPAAVAFGDFIYPFTTLINPTLLYCNLKAWSYLWTKSCRAALKLSRFVAAAATQSVVSLAIAMGVSLKSQWGLEKLYGLKIEGLCLGPCWMVWAEFALMALAAISVALGWDFEGGLFERHFERQLESLGWKKEEKAAKEALATGVDIEKTRHAEKA
jgi:hypothetical protein